MRTDNYILMCEQAEEIQKVWEHKQNKKDDYVKNTQGLRFLTWIPTQEQLQEIFLKEYNNRPGSLAFKNGWIGDFLNWVKSLPNFNFIDFNELWLAFVMHEKYHKIWNGEKWVSTSV